MQKSMSAHNMAVSDKAATAPAALTSGAVAAYLWMELSVEPAIFAAFGRVGGSWKLPRLLHAAEIQLSSKLSWTPPSVKGRRLQAPAAILVSLEAPLEFSNSRKTSQRLTGSALAAPPLFNAILGASSSLPSI